MAQVNFVSYITFDANGGTAVVDTLASQRAAIADYLADQGGRLIAEVGEIRLDGFEWACTEVQRALALCRQHEAVLLVASLEGLTRDRAFLATPYHEVACCGLRFMAADMPQVNEGTIGVLAALAAFKATSERLDERPARKHDVLARLSERQRRETARLDIGPAHSTPSCQARTLERALRVAPVLAEIRAAGATTFEQVAHALNELGVPSARGNRWYPAQVRLVEQRIAAVA